MKKKYITLLCVAAASILILAACKNTQPDSMQNPSPSTNEGSTEVDPVGVTVSADKPLTGLQNFVPKAKIYRTNGNYNNLVPIQVTPDGKSLVSFPAPTDINASVLPVPLANGFLLDRRGVSADTRFTRYTYSEYEALSSPPSATALLNSIIPDAIITELIELPMTTAQANADTAEVNNLIREGLPGCHVILSQPKIE